jgi:hypothetical protein
MRAPGVFRGLALLALFCAGCGTVPYPVDVTTADGAAGDGAVDSLPSALDVATQAGADAPGVAADTGFDHPPDAPVSPPDVPGEVDAAADLAPAPTDTRDAADGPPPNPGLYGVRAMAGPTGPVLTGRDAYRTYWLTYLTSELTPRWRRWRQLHNGIPDGPVPIVARGSLLLFGRFDPGELRYVQPIESWGNTFWIWHNLPLPPGRRFPYNPTLVKWSGELVAVFAVDQEGHPWTSWQVGGSSPSQYAPWSPIGDMKIQFTGEIGVWTGERGRLRLVVRTLTGPMYVTEQRDPGAPGEGGWLPWQPLAAMPGGVRPSLEPLVIAERSLAVEILTRGTDNNLWTIRQPAPGAAWEEWRSLGSIVGVPAWVRAPDFTDQIFTRAPGGRVQTIYEHTEGGGWGQWREVGDVGDRRIEVDPTAVLDGAGRPQLFTVDVARDEIITARRAPGTGQADYGPWEVLVTE